MQVNELMTEGGSTNRTTRRRVIGQGSMPRVLAMLLVFANTVGCDRSASTPGPKPSQASASATPSQPVPPAAVPSPPAATSSPPPPASSAAKQNDSTKPKTSAARPATPREQTTLHFERVPLQFGLEPDKKASQAALAAGRRHAAKKDWAKAMRHFQRAVALDALNVSARGELGWALQQTGDSGVHLLRSAESIAEMIEAPLQLRSAIVFNLARAYELERRPGLAQRAKRRSKLLRGEKSAGSGACSVVVRVAEDSPFELLSWKEAHQRVAALGGPEWGIDAPAPGVARKRLCEKVDLVSKGSFVAARSCEPGRVYVVHTESGPQRGEHSLWPLSDGRVVYSGDARIGIAGQACEGAPARVPLAAGPWAVSTHVYAEPFLDPPELEGFDHVCARLALVQTVDLFDAELGRSFSIEGLGAEVTIALDPRAQRVSINGPFCSERVELAQCKQGICRPVGAESD